jgi:hypothetical protein
MTPMSWARLSSSCYGRERGARWARLASNALAVDPPANPAFGCVGVGPSFRHPGLHGHGQPSTERAMMSATASVHRRRGGSGGRSAGG